MAFNKLNNVWPKIGPRHLLNLYVGGQWDPGTKKSSQNCDWTHNKIQFSHNHSINITQFRFYMILYFVFSEFFFKNKINYKHFWAIKPVKTTLYSFINATFCCFSKLALYASFIKSNVL